MLNGKLKGYEVICIIVAAAAIAFVCGFFAGRGKLNKNVTVNVSDTVRAVQTENEGSAKAQTAVKDAEVSAETGTVNINTADMEEIKTLPGIGETLAKRIIAYREENGAFSSVEGVMEVDGIGEGKFEKIKPYISVE